MRQPREVEFSVHLCPFQYLKPLVTQSVRLFRSKLASSKRSVLLDTPEIDYRMLRNSFKKVENADDGRRLRWFTTLSDWNNDQLSQLDFSTRKHCDCGAELPSFVHLIWHCPLTMHLRESDPLINFLTGCCLPPALEHGIPCAMPANPDSE